ncbi:hypothetical protein F4818DRAFT_448742 [Hypoxylon cercidicola]|nr:hypothetical protein F4818DRAFT_448742 [Hypoxylon cercidicola]
MTPDTDNHSNAFLRICSYHRWDNDLILLRSRSHEVQLVQESPQTALKNLPALGLEILDRLPTELMSMVLYNLDLLSYFRFRQINRLAKHGLEGLRGLLRTNLAHSFTILDVLCPATIAKFARISTTQLDQLLELKLRIMPGFYWTKEEERRLEPPKYLVAEDQVVAILTSIGFLYHPFRAIAMQHDSLSKHSAKIEHGVSCKGCQVRVENTNAEPLYRDYAGRDRGFSTTSFMVHFTHCVEAQNMWARSQGGTRPIEEPELTRRRGYLSRPGPLSPDGLIR